MKHAALVIVLVSCVGCIMVPKSAGEERAMKVERSAGRVWIGGVEGFNSGEYASSVHGAQARILQTLNEPLSYDDLICYSGFAFRVGCHD